MAKEPADSKDDIILPYSFPQKVIERYQQNFHYRHDRGIYAAFNLGPQWNHSLKNPNAKGFRFGGKANIGYFIADGLALFVSTWGDFLEEASLLAAGPGIAFFIDSTNMSFDLAVGVGRSFNPIHDDTIKDFNETLLATTLSLGKYWWLSKNSCIGMTVSSGFHGFSIAQSNFNSVGWSAGLGLTFLYG